MSFIIDIKMSEIKKLEKELGLERNFEYSEDIETRKTQMKNSLNSLKYIKRMRKDSKTRMKYFTGSLFSCGKESDVEVFDEEDVYGLDKVQVEGYQELAGQNYTHQ